MLGYILASTNLENGFLGMQLPLRIFLESVGFHERLCAQIHKSLIQLRVENIDEEVVQE